MKIQQTQDSDTILFEAFKIGDRDAFSVLVARYANKLYFFLLSFVKDSETAKDLLQEVFIKIYTNAHQFKAGANFKPWLFTIARNTAFDFLKKKSSTPFSFLTEGEEDQDFDLEQDEALSPEIITDEKLFFLRMSQALNELAQIQSVVIELRLYHDMSFVEIADLLGKPVNTVKSQYLRGLKRLREKFEK